MAVFTRSIRCMLPAVAIASACAVAALVWAGPTVEQPRPTSQPASQPNADWKTPPSRTLPAELVHLHGTLGEMYALAQSNVLYRLAPQYSVASFEASAAGKPGALWWDWPGDQIGRWYSVLHVLRGSGAPGLEERRKAVADVIFPLQTAEGNFGPPNSADNDDARIPSGNGFALRGLVDAYLDTKDPRYLEAARKLARYFERIAPRWETRSDGKLHEFYGHCLDGLVALYEQDHDRAVLELAERLAGHAGRTAHTHHSLSLCRGLVDLARVTGKKEYLAKAEDYLAWCREHETVSGGLPEAMPESEQDEGCGLADWVVVNLMMFTATGEELYLDAAEHTLLNHFSMNQFSTGGFGHRSFSQTVVGGKKWQGWGGKFGSENPGCCSLWGLWALAQVGPHIVTKADRVVLVNLYAPATMPIPELHAHLEITSDGPMPTRFRIKVDCPEPQNFTLALRAPRWAKGMKVTCDGAPVAVPDNGERVVLSRTWAEFSNIDVEFPSELRAVAWPPQSPIGVGVFRGPYCLGLCGEVLDVAAPWALLVDAGGRPVASQNGKPQVFDGNGHIQTLVEPIALARMSPSVNNPAPFRIIFQTKRVEQ